jgi:hypothetical protein
MIRNKISYVDPLSIAWISNLIFYWSFLSSCSDCGATLGIVVGENSEKL